MEKDDETPTSMIVCKYFFLSLSLFSYFILDWKNLAADFFIAYMWFTEWAWEKVFT